MPHSICYVDEAGCATPMASATANTQPVFLVTGLFIDEVLVRKMTEDFTKLKKKYFPGLFNGINHQLDAMTIELKGVDIKKALRGDKGKKARKVHERFVDELIGLVKGLGAKYVSNIWVKGIGKPFKGHSVYSVSTQRIATLFEDYLFRSEHKGLIVSDFRSPGNNRIVSHSIFTQMYRKKLNGNAYPSLLEAPLFGVSNNHAGLQIVDILTSALLCPMATFECCVGHVANVHVNQADKKIKDRYRRRLRALQYETIIRGKKVYGVTLSDRHSKKRADNIFY